MNENELVEVLAALSHRQWAGWVGWMMLNWDELHPNGETYQTRWRRQMTTAYPALTEAEKESDRIEARKVIALLREKGVLSCAS